MPIAEVAGDTAARAALDEVAGALAAAEEEGRLVRKLPLDKIDIHYLTRDRMPALDDEEFEVLKTSIAARGQQTPIEVLQQSGNRFGLISGLRRYEALKALGKDTCLALVRRPDSAEAAYVAMVEENEIRADLSFYERANIAVQSVGARVYPNPAQAVKGLFASATPAKRSKILNFVTIRETLGPKLKFPTAIPEKLGLALAKAIEADRTLASRIGATLSRTNPADVAAERRVLERALKPERKADGAGQGVEIAPGISLQTRKGRVVLSGPKVDADFVEALGAWIRSR